MPYPFKEDLMTKKKVAKKAQAPAPVGRPTSYKPEYCKKIIDHMSNGSSILSFAKSIGTGRETLHGWAREFPEFSDALKLAKEYCELWWEEQGKMGLWEEQGERKISVGLFRWCTAARFGWREKQEVEMDATLRSSPLKEELKQKSTEELLDIIKAAKVKE